MTFNVDVSNKTKLQQQELQTGSTTEVKQAPVEIPIVQNKTSDNNIYTKLGISKEEYLKLCNQNPNFTALNFEEQLKYIQSINKTSIDISNINKDNEVKDTETETLSVYNNSNSENNFSKKVFSKLDINEQFNIYSTELAKNKFLYGDAQKKSIEDWNNLSENEKNKLITDQQAALVQQSLKLNQKNTQSWLDTSMTELLAANNVAMSFEEFQKSPEGYKDVTIYDYLLSQDIKNLSFSDRIQLQETELLCNAASFMAKSDVKMCPDEARAYFAENKLSPMKAEYEYLQNKIDNGEEISKSERQRYESLNEIMKSAVAMEAQENFGARTGETPALIKEIANSSYAEAFEKADTKNKILLLKDYIENTYDKKDPKYPQIIENLMNDAIECGSYELAFGLHQMAKYDARIAKNFADSNNKTIKITNAINTDNLNKYGKDFVAKADKQGEHNFVLAAQNSADESQFLDISEITAFSENQEVANNTVKMGQRTENAEIAIGVANNVKKSGNQKAIELGAATADKNTVDAQNEVLSIYTKDNEGATHAAIKANVTEKMHAKNQAEAFEMLLKRNEEYTKDPEEAQKYSIQLADQVENLDASVQADAHKMVSQSKYEEVVQHAAENIYKYDKSAQKEALKYTLETGNEKAIENAISNIDKCEGLANETSALPSNAKDYDSQLARDIQTYTAQIEQKYSQEVAKDYASYMAEQDLRSGIISVDEEKTEMQKYIEKFKDPNVNKFALLGQLEPSLRKEALKALVKYAPTMINAFIDMGYGPDILKIIGETSDMAVKIVNLMDFKGQAEVKNIVQKYPDNFEELYIKYFAEDDKPSQTQSAYNTSPFGSDNLLKRIDKNGKAFFSI